jgi:beta-glucosidase
MAEKGTWTVKIGVDAQTFYGAETFEIEENMPWIGL